MAIYLLVNYNFFPFAGGGTEHYVLEQSKYLKSLGHSAVVMAPIEREQQDCISVYSDDNLNIVRYEFEGQEVWGVKVKPPSRMDLYKKDSIRLQISFHQFFTKVASAVSFTSLELHAFTACFGIHFIEAFKEVFPSGPVRYYQHIPINCPKHTLENSGRECRVVINKENCTPCVQRTYDDEFYIKWFDALSPVYFSFLPAPLNRKHLIESAIESFKNLTDVVGEVIVFSEDMASRINFGPKVRMVRHGIKPEFLDHNYPSRDTAVITFSYLGRIEKIKGIVTLAKAWDLLPVLATRRLRIAGDLSSAPDELKENLLQLSKRGDVELVGYVKEGVGSFLGTTHCLIVPSEWYETGPMVIHEAIACGANIIGSDIGGVKELCNHYHQTIFTAFDEQDLAGKIRDFQYNGLAGKKPVTYETHFAQLFGQRSPD